MPGHDTFLQLAYIDQLNSIVTTKLGKVQQGQKQINEGNLVMLKNEKRALEICKLYIQKAQFEKVQFGLEETLIEAGIELKSIAESNNCVFIMKVNPVPKQIVGVKELLLCLFTFLGQIAI